MKYLRFFVLLCGFIGSLNAVNLAKEGTIPMYEPYGLGLSGAFLPYNPNVIIVGDQVADLALNFAKSRDHAAVFCFSSEENDFNQLNYYAQTNPGIHPHFGLLHAKQEGSYPYFSTLSQDLIDPNYRFAGSLLAPSDSALPFLFGKRSFLPTFSLSQFCKQQEVSRVHMFHLDCGGTELQILRSDPDLVKNAIIVYVKTYHRPIRKGISLFSELNEFMLACGFELATHYIYDDTIGDALYVKGKYFNGVFRRKEI